MELETRSRGELLAKLQQVTLRGSSVQPYLNARIDVVTLMPSELSPCQRYCLITELKKVEQLRWDILEASGHIDILRLDGYVKCKYPVVPAGTAVFHKNGQPAGLSVAESPEKTIDVIPPVCEEFFTPDYKLKIKINDGLHRVYLAYQMGVPVTVAYVRGINPNYPYYSNIIPTSWEGVELIESLDENYIKKFHVAKDHRRLFRNFNSTLENIGDSRPREQLVMEGVSSQILELKE